MDPRRRDRQATAYGLAVWKHESHGYAFVTQRHATQLAMTALTREPHGLVGYTVVDTITMPDTFALPNGDTWSPCEEPGEGPQFEGRSSTSSARSSMRRREDVGVWRIPISTHGFGRPELIEKVKEFGFPATFDPVSEECVAGPDPGFGGQHLAADAEGLTIYYGRGVS